MNKIGIMQGRLTPSQGRGIQFFPFGHGEWQEEFVKAQKLGLYDIDFNFDLERYEENPLWTKKGREEIKNIIKKTGVKVDHITADFFMRSPFFRVDKKTQKENENIFIKLVKYTNEIGVKNIEIPILDNSSIRTDDERKIFIESMSRSLSKIPKNMTISLEADLSPAELLKLIKEIGSSVFKIVYDIGNRVGLGYSPEDEILLLYKYITHIHIKDKPFQGSTIQIGTGSAKFDEIFSSLASINFKGNFILQAARGKDGEEEKNVSRDIKFIKNLIQKYL
ncbi:MAG: sugar phosphate isomerase/epimerase [Patescibacteria group bacterium]|nr:sugar phosphate isomerase/epimerase [Patescibacteria group bacterium]